MVMMQKGVHISKCLVLCHIVECSESGILHVTIVISSYFTDVRIDPQLVRFTVLQLCSRGIAMSICPSVCLSVKRVNCDKTKQTSAHILIKATPTIVADDSRRGLYISPLNFFCHAPM